MFIAGVLTLTAALCLKVLEFLEQSPGEAQTQVPVVLSRTCVPSLMDSFHLQQVCHSNSHRMYPCCFGDGLDQHPESLCPI